MKKLTSKPSTRSFNIVLIAIALFATVISMIFGSYLQQGYELFVGDVAPRTFVASHQIENRVATERLRQAARDHVAAVTTRDTEAEERSLTQLENLFSTLSELRERYHDTVVLLPALPPPVFVQTTPPATEPSDTNEDTEPDTDAATYTHELESDNGDVDTTTASELAPTAPVNPFAPPTLPEIPFFDQLQVAQLVQSSTALSTLSRHHLEFLITAENSLFAHLQTSVMDIFAGIMAQELHEGRAGFTEHVLNQLTQQHGISYPLHIIAYHILDSYVEPNIIVNEEATNLLREEHAGEVVPVIFLQNQVIINAGQILSEETYVALTDLGYITQGHTISYIPIMGASVLMVVMFAVVIFYIYQFTPSIRKHQKHVLLLFTLYMLLVASASALTNVPFVFVPQLMFTMLVGMLLNNYKLAIVINIAVTLLNFLIVEGDISFILYFLTTGTVVALVTRYALQRNKVLIFSLFISLVSGVVAVSVSLLIDRTLSQNTLLILSYGLAAGFFSVILCMGTLPLWESVFGVITPIKLLDLTNPSNPLLRRLSVEAPGTYHHSIIVANLAEAAAYDIGADTIVTRVGAFFHDIGKLRHPAFFIENQVGINPHDEIYPLDSAEIIIDHVAHGVELADSYKLPLVLRDIIAQHHGKTVLKYFYDKEIKAEQQALYEATPNDYADPADIQVSVDPQLFSYPGPIPQFKEAALVMLADTVEAAIRSMSTGKNKVDISKKVHELVNNKLSTGQLLESGLTIKDIQTIEEAFIRVFSGMYHERIPYPVTTKR